MARGQSAQGDEAIIKQAVDEFERRFRRRYTQWQEAVIGGEGQGSFTTTVTGTRKKLNKIDFKITSRVRTPDEAFEFLGTVTDDGQMVMGWQEPEPAEPGE